MPVQCLQRARCVSVNADLDDAMSPVDLTAAMDMQTLQQAWFVQGCSALTGDGLLEGLDWAVTP